MFCDVLVKVAACGITHNELDWPIWTCRAGHQRDLDHPRPRGVGSGRRAGIRDGRDRRRRRGVRADRPATVTAAAAEYVAVEARNVAPKPQTVDHVHAAAVPRAGLTAWQALFDHGKLAKGQTVVIHGAGGAVGSTAVQLARWAGAEVIGTGRSQSRPLVMELGADRFVALDADRLEDAAGRGRPGVRHDRRRGAGPLARPAQARGNAGHGEGRLRSCPPAGTTSGRSSSSRSPAALS